MKPCAGKAGAEIGDSLLSLFRPLTISRHGSKLSKLSPILELRS
jgi:hypothetical protein